MAYQKRCILRFRKDLKLDDETYWQNERLEASFAANIKTYSSLLVLLIGQLENANETIWDRLKKSEAELAKLIDILSEP